MTPPNPPLSLQYGVNRGRFGRPGAATVPPLVPPVGSGGAGPQGFDPWSFYVLVVRVDDPSAGVSVIAHSGVGSFPGPEFLARTNLTQERFDFHTSWVMTPGLGPLSYRFPTPAAAEAFLARKFPASGTAREFLGFGLFQPATGVLARLG